MAMDSGKPTDRSALRAEAESVSRPVIRLFSDYGPRYPLELTVGLIAALVAPVLTLLPVYLLHLIIDGLLLGKRSIGLLNRLTVIGLDSPKDRLVLAVVCMLGVATLSSLANVVGSLAWGQFAQAVQHEFRTDLYNRLQSYELAFFDNHSTGQLMSVLQDDIEELNTLLENFLQETIETIAKLLGISILLVILNLQLAVLVLAMVPIMVLLARWFVNRIGPWYRQLREEVAEMNSRFETNLNGIRVIRAFGGEDVEQARVQDASRRVYEANWQLIRARSTFFPTINLLNWSMFCVVLLVGGIWYLAGPPFGLTGEMSLGVLVAFLLYARQLTRPVMRGSQLFDLFFEARAATRRLYALQDCCQPVEDSTPPANSERIRGRIRFEQVGFEYSAATNPTLSNISFTATPGEVIGIVGETGAGKSTLLELLLRFRRPSTGVIRLDGKHLDKVATEELRREIAYVDQESYLFAGSVRENISYPTDQPKEEAIDDALKAAGATDLREELPTGLETTVGHEGTKLSGGQRQRIALARALYQNPRILLLDEATSHVDTATQRRIRQALSAANGDRTTLIVAHRLSTVRHADQIIVLSGGEIVERGTHSELIAQAGHYAELWHIQTGAQVSDPQLVDPSAG